MKRVLITGNKGQLGQAIHCQAENYGTLDIIGVDFSELDLTNKSAVDAFFDENSFDVIVNCAAYTNVDSAENNVTDAENINHLAVGFLADNAKKYNSKLIHISTDYVFNGASEVPYKEEDKTDPINVYGVTKLKGEEKILEINPPGAVIVRTSWLYSDHGTNFVKTIRKLALERDKIQVVSDQIGSPTYAYDLADFVLMLIKSEMNERTEVFHFSNAGTCSWYQFAKEIVAIDHLNCHVEPVLTSRFKSVARRPMKSVLNLDKTNAYFDFSIPEWRESLRNCLNKM